MRSLLAIAVIAALAGFGLVAAAALASGEPDPRLAQAPPSAAAPSVAAPSSGQPFSEPDVAAFEERVAGFITEFYLSGDNLSEADLERIYADEVDYFGKRHRTRAQVLADKRAYFARWPERRYRLLRETLGVVRRPGASKVYDVSFDYEFAVAGPSRASRGRGRALLTLDLGQEGGRITRETGQVLRRK